MSKNPYSSKDAGCYVDSVHGIYAADAIVGFARAHGAKIAHEPSECCDGGDPTSIFTEFSGCEFAHEYEDEADAYMEEHFQVDNHYWGRSEQGDWGLWECEP